MLKNVFNVALSILFSPPLPPPHLMWLFKCVCVCVCVCVWLFLSFCFLFSLSYWLSYFCLVTIVLFCQSCLQNVKNKNKLFIITLLFFFFFPPPPPHPPCYYYYYYYCMQRLKESCNVLASVPGLPCAQKWKRKKGKKQEINSSEANRIPNSQYNINFGWWLAFISFCLDEQIYCKRNIWVVTASSAS